MRGVNAAIGDCGVAAAVDVDAVTVGIHGDIVDGHIITAGDEDREVSAMEDGDVADEDVFAKLESNSLIGRIVRPASTRPSAGPGTCGGEVSLAKSGIIPPFKCCKTIPLIEASIHADHIAAVDHALAGDGDIREVFAPDEAVVKVSVARILIGGAFEFFGVVVGVRIERRSKDSATGIQMEVDIALHVDGTAKVGSRTG